MRDPFVGGRVTRLRFLGDCGWCFTTQLGRRTRARFGFDYHSERRRQRVRVVWPVLVLIWPSGVFDAGAAPAAWACV